MFQLAPWQHHSSQPFSDTDNSSSSSSSSSSSPLSSPSSSFLTPYHHPTTPSNSTTTTTTTTPLLPISSFLSSTFSLLDETSFTDTLPPGFLENALADEDFLPDVVEEEEQVQLYPPSLFATTTTSSSFFHPFFTSPSPHETLNGSGPGSGVSSSCPGASSSFQLLPAGVTVGDHAPDGFAGVDRLLGGDRDYVVAGAGACGGSARASSRHRGIRGLDDMDRARRRQIKVEQRKQRNKEAARRSNENKKLLRESLQKKSVELCEENLQLRQDIQDLNDQLRHFRHLRNSIKHVCQRRQLHPMVMCR